MTPDLYIAICRALFGAGWFDRAMHYLGQSVSSLRWLIRSGRWAIDADQAKALLLVLRQRIQEIEQHGTKPFVLNEVLYLLYGATWRWCLMDEFGIDHHVARRWGCGKEEMPADKIERLRELLPVKLDQLRKLADEADAFVSQSAQQSRRKAAGLSHAV